MAVPAMIHGRDARATVAAADKGDEAPFLGDGRQTDGVAVHGNVEVGLMLVPAQVLVEEGLEVEGLQALANCGGINLHFPASLDHSISFLRKSALDGR